MLAARDKAREAFGRTETQFHRLMHTRFYGVDTPFEAHSDESLILALGNVADDNRAADDHYRYEVRSHRLGLVVANRDERDYHEVALRLSLTRIPGVGVAGRVYTEAHNAPMTDGYPAVTRTRERIIVQAAIGTLPAGRQVNAFRESPRFWARQEAASKSVSIDYELTADALPAPVTGTLFIDVEPESLRSV
jgi:hypothetical protein